jgi:hypothetical protein
MGNKNKIAFAKQLIKFYEESISSSITPIQGLIDIQENFPEEYNAMLKFRDDPSELTENKSIPNELKSELLLITIKASKLGAEAQNIYLLSLDEKKELIKKINDFKEYVKNLIEKYSKIEVEK